jgi:prephenate dehydrogenase
MEPCRTATIIGVGLLGGSLGLALKARGLAACVHGVGRRRESLAVAERLGAIDTAFLDPAEAVADADLVVICTPANLVAPMLDAVVPRCRPAALITDVASTKAAICAHADGFTGDGPCFVGSHPMAGSERFGPEHADPRLYEGAWTIVTPTGASHPEAVARTESLWRAVGCTVAHMEPAAHDAVVARTSHLPHIAAACLAQVAAENHPPSAAAGKGFRDTTRIAAGRPSVWRDICLTNREAILAALAAFDARVAEARKALEAGDAAALEAFFAGGAEARREVLGE